MSKEEASGTGKSEPTGPKNASVIMVSYNGSHYLDDCLRSVYHELRPGDEVIVVDNA